MYSELDSHGSPPSFGTLCLTFTSPQHCEEAWEWFDKCSVDTAPGDKYEGIHSFKILAVLEAVLYRVFDHIRKTGRKPEMDSGILNQTLALDLFKANYYSYNVTTRIEMESALSRICINKVS